VKQGLSLGFSQSLTLTPQLQQSIRLLQLSSLELEVEIEQQLATNPFLERDDEASDLERFDTATQSTNSTEREGESEEEGDGEFEPSDTQIDDSSDLAPNDSEWGVEAQGATQANQFEGEYDPLGGLSDAEQLQQHLKRQALHLRLNKTDAASLDFLIDSLDERGFLCDSLEDLARSLSEDQEEIERLVEQLCIAKNWLQNLEPTGVGASDVSECLRLQLLTQMPNQQLARASDVQQVAWRLLYLPLQTLAGRNIKRLAVECECLESHIQQGLQAIRALEPAPARRFTTLHVTTVVPDVFVRLVVKNGKTNYVTELNLDLMPKLKVDEITVQLLKLHKARQSKHDAMQQSLVEARGFIKSISQRFDTVLRVARAIVARQGQFLQHGALAMRPLVLRDIADELGLHESTVSRVTTNKYMATPQGTFEFKYFFDAGLATNSGGETSGTAVRALIAQLIAAENKAKPLSDGKIAALLEQQGIACARRTVAKYREALRIPVASLRKTT
jgi:RNA polymerase sigma-54 factor